MFGFTTGGHKQRKKALIACEKARHTSRKQGLAAGSNFPVLRPPHFALRYAESFAW